MSPIPQPAAADTKTAKKRSASWIAELALMLALLFVANALLPPEHSVFDLQPNVFWLPVLLMAVAHGTLAALAASAVATGLAFWLGDQPSAHADVYEQALAFWKEPVLWLVASFAIGAFRDRHAEERQTLQRQLAQAREHRARIAEHAIALRERIDALESEIAFAAPPPAPSAPSLEIVSDTGEPVAAARARIGTAR